MTEQEQHDEETKQAVDGAKTYCDNVAKQAFEEIDSIINSLSNLRKAIELDCIRTYHHMNGYLKLIGDAIKSSRVIEETIKALEDHHNQSPTAPDLPKQVSNINKQIDAAMSNIGKIGK